MMQENVHAPRTVTADGWAYKWIDGGSAVKLVRYLGDATSLATPEQICGAPVTLLGREAFAGNRSIAMVRISDSIVGVEDGSGLRRTGAFYGCERLSEVILSAGMSRVADYMFYGVGCGRDTALRVDFRRVREIGDFSFACCNNIVRLHLPESVVRIGAGAFYQARRLAALDMPGACEVAADAFTETMFEEAHECAHASGNIPNIVYADRVAYLCMGSCAASRLSLCEGTLGISEALLENPFTDFGAWKRCLREVEVPDSLRFIPDGLFEAFEQLVLCGRAGRYAQRYAERHANLRFREM